LIITKARGYWIDAAFGIFILMLIIERHHKLRLSALISIGPIVAFALITLAFGNLGFLLIEGVIDRFSTLETAAVTDISLVNRFNEAAHVWDKIQRNPFLGYGLGAEFSFYNWIYRSTLTGTFIHNGYVALWFKLGLPGLLLMIIFWWSTALKGYMIYAQGSCPDKYRMIALAASVSLISIFPSVNTSSPFFMDDQMLSMTILAGLCTGLYERVREGNFPDRALL
jgi:O-antigen ligase